MVPANFAIVVTASILQAIQAGQVTVEDHLMSDMDIDPLLVVGWEGLIGSLVMLGGALPLLQRLPYRDGSGFAEDTLGSLCMIRNSVAIAGEGPSCGWHILVCAC